MLPVLDHRNRSDLSKRLKRQIRSLIHGDRYAPCKELPGAKIMTNRMQRTHAWCKPLHEPDWCHDYAHLRADDPALGVYRNAKAWALPWWIMKNHHVANLVLDSQPILVTLCEVCSSASAFHSNPNLQRLNFRLAGLYNGTNMITDLETGSFWNPSKGEALTGPKKGTVLERIALVQCEWREWLGMHPGSLVLWDEQEQREGHGSHNSPGSPGIGLEMRETLVRPIDERLEHNIMVLGVEGNGTGFAFPLQELDKVGAVMHTTVDGNDTVIFHLPGSLHALAYSAVLDGQKLEFVQDAQGLIADKQTGSHWDYAGECYTGPHRGDKLRYVNSGVEEWYIWAAYHPSTNIFSAQLDPIIE
jgi:Protein of unknown function (DUF3179)